MENILRWSQRDVKEEEGKGGTEKGNVQESLQEIRIQCWVWDVGAHMQGSYKKMREQKVTLEARGDPQLTARK